MLTIIQVAVPTPLRQIFDYLPPKNIAPEAIQAGCRVQVPFGKNHCVGVVVGQGAPSIDIAKLKPITSLLDEKPLLPKSLFALIQWASDYYQHPIGEVASDCLPPLLKKRMTKPFCLPSNETGEHRGLAGRPPCLPLQPFIELNAAQQNAIQTILSAQGFARFLLDGVTGSGKTEVYLRVIAEILQKGKQALVLVPEIGLTPQTLSRFENRFPNHTLVVFHSKMTDKQRTLAWLLAQAGQAHIIIGTRSAIFTPMKNPGIIILDEEHDLSFKQQSGFLYSARDLALVRGQLEHIPVVLGSATPSLKSLHNVQIKRYQHLVLPERAGEAVPPRFRIVDIRNERLKHGLSKQLLESIHRHLTQQSQVLLFLNRRGFAPTLLCHSCGWIACCRRCDARMTLHQEPAMLHCHHCTACRKPDTVCPQCNSQALLQLGLGTERLELGLQKHFTDHRILRIDSDTTRRRGQLEAVINQVETGEPMVLIGTQMIAKGHHFPNVTLVGVINIDAGFYSPDFRATERMAQLLVQVAGRAGRAEKPGEVLIQTHLPDHPLMQCLIREGYPAFARMALAERKEAGLPPFAYHALLRTESTQQPAVETFMQEAKQQAGERDGIIVLGPVPAPMERKAGRHRMHLLIQAEKRVVLQRFLTDWLVCLGALKSGRAVRWSVDVDPQDMS